MSKPDFTGSWALVESNNIPTFLGEMECPTVKVMAMAMMIKLGTLQEECIVDPIDPKSGAFTFHIKNAATHAHVSYVPDGGRQTVKGTPLGDLTANPVWEPLRAGTSGRPCTGGLALSTSFETKGKEIKFMRHLEKDHKRGVDLMVNEFFVNGQYVASKVYERSETVKPWSLWDSLGMSSS